MEGKKRLTLEADEHEDRNDEDEDVAEGVEGRKREYRRRENDAQDAETEADFQKETVDIVLSWLGHAWETSQNEDALHHEHCNPAKRLNLSLHLHRSEWEL